MSNAATLDGRWHWDDLAVNTAVADEYYALDAAGFFDSIGKALSSIGKKIAKGASKAWGTIKTGVATALDSPIGQAVMNYASAIPGYGTAIGAGLGALHAAAKGKDWTEIVASAAKKALPGGIANAAIDVAQKGLQGAIKGGAKGALAGSLGAAANAGLSALLPKGANPHLTKLAGGLASGLVSAGVNALPFGSPQKKAANLASIVTKGGMQGVANALLSTPALRALGTSALASKLGVTPKVAEAAQRSILRLGTGAGAPALPANFSIDQAAMLLGTPRAPSSTANVTPRVGGFAALSRPQEAAGVDERPQATQARFRGFHPGVVPNVVRAVPALKRVDRRFLALVVRGSAQTSDAAGIHPGDPRKWTIAPGETLSSIAAQLGHPGEPMVLYAANKSPLGAKLTNPSVIYPGQVLTIPEAWVVSVPSSPAPGPFPTDAPMPPNPTSTPASGPWPRAHIVQAGETLSSIAADFGHPGEAMTIYAVNKAPLGAKLTDPSVIHPGQTLVLPEGWSARTDEPAPGTPPWTSAPTPPAPVPPSAGTAPPVAPDAATIATAQVRLSSWRNAYQSACVPANWGSSPADFTATITPRFTSALASFQKWANHNAGAALREDGALDEATNQTLASVAATILATGGYPTPSAPTNPGIPASPPSIPEPFPPVGGGIPPWLDPNSPGYDPNHPENQIPGLPTIPGLPGGGTPPTLPGQQPPPKKSGAGMVFSLLALGGLAAAFR